MKKYKECEKLSVVHDESQKLGEFLDWLRNEKNYTLSEYVPNVDGCCYESESEVLMPVTKGIEALLAEYFDVDLDKVEKERRHMLAAFQTKNEKA